MGWVSAMELNAEFRSRGLVMFVDTDNRLKVYPKRLLTQELQAAISGRWDEIAQFLTQRARQW
jgi:hypothetical protein